MIHPPVAKTLLADDLWTMSGEIYALAGLQSLLLDWQDIFHGHVNGVLFAIWCDVRCIKLNHAMWIDIQLSLDASHANDVAPLRALRRMILKSEKDAYQQALHDELMAEKRQQSLLIESLLERVVDVQSIVNSIKSSQQVVVPAQENCHAYMTHHIDTCLSGIALKDAARAHIDKITQRLNENN